MLNRLLSYLGFCRHQNIGWPQWKDKRSGVMQVQCHDCQHRLVYDWMGMQIVNRKSRCADVTARVKSEAGS